MIQTVNLFCARRNSDEKYILIYHALRWSTNNINYNYKQK